MAKSRDAFRTISEVSDALDTPAHVLRFWESKFSQIKPVKRAGGRRYYRPGDLNLLAGIKQLLHEEGMTIKGAQKLLREKGVKHVTAIGAGTASAMDDATPEVAAPKAAAPIVAPAPETKQMFDDAAAPQAGAPAPQAPTLQILSASARRTMPPAPVPPTDAAPAAQTRAPAPTPVATPKSFDHLPGRALAAATRAKMDRVHANAAEIAPLLMRLAKLRDTLRETSA